MRMPPGLSRRGQERFLQQERVVARDSNLSISVWHPSLKPATSSWRAVVSGCVQGEGRHGTVCDIDPGTRQLHVFQELWAFGSPWHVSISQGTVG